MKKSIFILFLLLFSANITAQYYLPICQQKAPFEVPVVMLPLNYYIIVENDTIFLSVETRPLFPGGDEEMLKFLNKNLRIPFIYFESLPRRRVFVQFVVERDGTITHIEVIRGVSPGFDAEVVRVIGLMPKWTPGKQNGKPVRVRVIVPVGIRFQ